jgi:hypothetical protein
MTRWPNNAHEIIVMAANATGLEHILIGIAGSIAIGLDRISMSVNGGFDGGSFNQFHLAVLGYQPQQRV